MVPESGAAEGDGLRVLSHRPEGQVPSRQVHHLRGGLRKLSLHSRRISGASEAEGLIITIFVHAQYVVISSAILPKEVLSQESRSVSSSSQEEENVSTLSQVGV